MKKIKGLLYCCKAKPYLYKTHFVKVEDVVKGINNKFIYEVDNHERAYLSGEKRPFLNGKIVAECDFDVEDLRIVDDDPLGAYWYETKTLSENKVLEKSCLTSDELYDYLGEYNEGYAIHIKNLHIFDKPRDLSDYCTKQCQFAKCSTCIYGKNNITCSTIDTPITKAPQNMQFCYYYNKEKGNWEKAILISIRPEWLCKILNGEKTIECRKRILKEMMSK